jgi:hypothetical protein
MPNEFDEVIQRTLGKGNHKVFLQHQYLMASYKPADREKYITTTPLENCVAVFIYGKKDDEIIGVGIHISINQSKNQIDALIKKLKEEFTEVNKVTFVGGDFGITPPPFRSNVITHAAKSALTKYLGVNEFTHEHYNWVGNCACCCYFFFRPFEKKYTVSLDLETGKVLVSSNENISRLIFKNHSTLVEATTKLLNQQTSDYYSTGNLDSHIFLTPEQVLSQSRESLSQYTMS